MIKMDRIDSFSPTPSSSHQQHYQQPIYYEQQIMYAQVEHPMQYDMAGQPLMTPQGRMIMPMSSHPSSAHASMECGPSPFLPEIAMSPFGHPVELPSNASPMMMNGNGNGNVVSPTEHLHQAPNLHRNHSLPLTHTSLAHRTQRHNPAHASSSRPGMTRGHTMQIPPRPAPLQRQASLQVAPGRSASPHMMAGDIFDPTPGSPIKRPSSTLGFQVDAGQVYEQEMVFNGGQGISPARALGPAPSQPQQFSPTNNDPMITPYGHKTNYEKDIHSSATSSTATSSSSVTASSHHTEKRRSTASDEENDSPTRGPSASRAMSKMQLNERAGPSRGGPSRPQTLVVRPQRPQVKPVIGGRTSAKFAKVAEDPGVEGIPPGPRPMDRPGPSFACIIGQAILKCSAGGLSLEHIYRYVETAYPFFKSGDGAWRNSVRHNLSIHKMFETIPRTEKFPPGKGGIWIIHEDEKCHWPEENKFIKNFPASHPHHAVCRQTLHERAKEQDAIDRAAQEGREYVPKKGKKGRKLPMKDDDGDNHMIRTSSDMGDHHFAFPSSITPTMQSASLPPVPFIATSDADYEDDGDFLPEDDSKEVRFEEIHIHHEEIPARPGMMVPPRIERREKRRLLLDEENVFTTAKRVRVAEPGQARALAPIHPQPQESVVDLDDTFITPERERPTPSANKVMSSAFKTPALVNTSSSPGSSPMPPTITRTTHHPSALQQAWTHDDMADASNDSSPQRPMLDAAFDFQPKGNNNKSRARALVAEDEYPVSSNNPPKTPLSRSSAAREMNKTPGNGIASKTPLSFGRSPAQPPPTISALLSTPMWEMGGCLDRLKDYGSSPTASIRSPMPPTSPTRYAMLMGSGASPQSRRMREFSL